MKLKKSIQLVFFLTCIISLTFCKAKREFEFTNENPTGDSLAVLSVTYDKDGNVISGYISDELRQNINNIEGAGELNDGAHYEFKEENGIRSKIGVFQRSLSTEKYVVSINNDTIRVGEEFKGEITLFYDDFDIKIVDEKLYKRIETVNARGIKNIDFILESSELGVKKFKGTLKNESKEVPFELYYVVVPNG